MNCRDTTEHYTDYLEGKLGEVPLQKRIRVRLHLLICPYCKTFAEQMDSTVRAAAEIEAPPNEELDQRVISAFREKRAKT
jgi:hypothetical protein